MKKLIYLFVLTLGIFSCSTDDDVLNLSGLYTESKPFSGNHQLNFIDNNSLILKTRNAADEEFIYSLSDNSLKLTPIRDLSQTWELEINFVNNSKFEIINIFYASIPEDDDAIKFVTFEK